ADAQDAGREPAQRQLQCFGGPRRQGIVPPRRAIPLLHRREVTLCAKPLLASQSCRDRKPCNPAPDRSCILGSPRPCYLSDFRESDGSALSWRTAVKSSKRSTLVCPPCIGFARRLW